MLADAWEWDGASWARVAVPLSPLARSGHVLVPSPEGRGVLLFGGSPFGAPSAVAMRGVSLLRWDGVIASDSCRTLEDSDGDGLRGCDDPDCWPVCQPLCSPGVECGAGTPRCGDAAHTEVETCGICAVDQPQACAERCGDFACTGVETATSCPGDCP